MTSRPALEVVGLSRLARTMRKLGQDLGELKELNRQAAETVAGAARPSGPVRSGRLVSTLRTGATQRAGIVRAGRASVPYAGPIHWGWPSRNIKPNPFISEAAEATEPAWTEIYLAGVNVLIQKVEGK